MGLHIQVGMIVPGRAGGIYVTEKAMVEELRRRPGVSVGVFEFGSRKEDESTLERIAGRLRDFLSYSRLLRRQRPDVVYINTAYNKRALLRDIGYAFLSRLHRVPLVVKEHGCEAWLVQQRPEPWWTMTRLIVGWSAMIYLLSTDEIRLFGNAGFPREKLRLVKNVVSLDRFRGAGGQTFEPAGILFIARFIPEKGLFDLLRAARILRDGGHAFGLHCVGDGPIRREAEEMARDLGLDDLVSFTGQISEEAATEYYRRSSILVLPTYFHEGFPMTILQGLAAGLPIVTTRIRAAADYLTEPDNCLWVNPRDPEMLARCLARLLADQPLREAMRGNNLALAEGFAVEAVADEYLGNFLEAARISRPL